ncbi:MAG: hypothetical protein ACK5MP_01015 [Nostocoides sp.]
MNDAKGPPRRVVVRAKGYLLLILSWICVLLVAAVGAFLDSSLDGQRDPDWMLWALTAALTALIARAPFVGVVVADGRVRRRTWLRSQEWDAREAKVVGSSGYSGALNRYSTSRRYKMVIFAMQADRHEHDVPELSGRPATVDRFIDQLNAALSVILRQTDAEGDC